MYARRFLIVVTIFTLLVVAAAFAIFQFGGTVLRQSFTPQGSYVPPPPASGPDYASAESWIARPDFEPRDNPALWWPANWPTPTLQARHAAVFPPDHLPSRRPLERAAPGGGERLAR